MWNRKTKNIFKPFKRINMALDIVKRTFKTDAFNRA